MKAEGEGSFCSNYLPFCPPHNLNLMGEKRGEFYSILFMGEAVINSWELGEDSYVSIFMHQFSVNT